MASITRVSVKKPKNKRDRHRWVVRWREDGKAFEEWHSSASAAEEQKQQIERDTNDGISVDPKRGSQLLNDYFDAWLPTRLVKGRPLALGTKIGYRRLWQRNIAESLGKQQLRAVRPDAVRTWHGALAISSSQDQAAKAYRLLRAVMITAETDQLIRLNPCRVRGAGQEHAAERPLVATSLALELADTIDPRYRGLVLLASFGGLRTGESLGLCRCDVDLLHRQVKVREQAQELAGSGRVTGEPKSEAGKRKIAVPEVVVKALEEHLAQYVELGVESPVFTGPEGGPLRRATLSDAWRAAVKKAGAPKGLHLHDLRHHAATLTAQMPGVTTKQLMAHIGHSSYPAALKYQHATEERDEAIAVFMDGRIMAATPPQRAEVISIR